MKLKFRTLIFLLLILFCIAVFCVYRRQAYLGVNTSLSQCVPITEGLSSSNLSGWMVYESRQEDEDSFAVDLQTGTKLPLEHLTADTLIGPSKAGRIVYDDYDLNNWVVVGLADGVKTISVVKVNSAMPIDWAGERLVLGGDRLQLLDMENGDIESVISDADFSKIGNAIDWPSKLNWSGYSPYHIVPSPDLTNLALAASGEPAPSLVLWDLKNARVSAQLLWADTLSSPKWSPDGAGVISSAPPYIFYDMKQYVNIQDNLPYVGGSDVMYLGVDGRVRRLTTFASVVKASENRYVWSPDGSRIAVMVDFTVNGVDTHRLAVIQFVSGEVTNFCLPDKSAEVVGYPVWSPDSQAVALTVSEEGAPLQTYIVDAKTCSALETESGMQIVGWWQPQNNTEEP